MNVSRIISGAALCVAISATPLQSAAEPLAQAAKLAYAWRPGQVRRYDYELRRDQSSGSERIYQTRFLLRAEIRMEALMVDDKGALIELSFPRLRMEYQAGKTHSVFDSSRRAATSDAALWSAAGDAVIAAKIRLLQDRTGSCDVLAGVERELRAACSDKRDAAPRRAFILEQIFNDRPLAQLLDAHFALLPENGKLQEEWSIANSVDLGFGIEVVRRIDCRARIDEPRGDSIQILIEGRIESADVDKALVSLPGGSAEIELLDNRISGAMLFEPGDGTLRYQKLNGTLNMRTILRDASLPDGGSVIGSSLRQTSILKLLDESER
jgi:hypothetical protein